MNIPVGYRLVISTWENDGDNEREQVFNGLSKEDAKYLVALAKMFRSMSNHDGGFGGSAHHYKLNKRGTGDFWADLIVEMEKLAKKHPKISVFIQRGFTIDREEAGENLEGWYNDLVCQLVGIPGEDYQDEDYIRVYDSHAVYYIHEEIKDVTKEFK